METQFKETLKIEEEVFGALSDFLFFLMENFEGLYISFFGLSVKKER